MIPVKVAITGKPGAGKTAIVQRIAEMIKDHFTIGGYITLPIIEDDELVGYRLRNFVTGLEEVAAHRDWDIKPKINELGIRLDAVDRIATAALLQAIADHDLILIDEVGKLVSDSREYGVALKEALKCEKPMLITMHKRSRNPLLQTIRRRDDLRTLEVTPINAAILPSKVVRILKSGM